MKKFKAVEAGDVVFFLQKIEKKLINILKLDPPEQKDAIEELFDFVRDMELDLDSEIDEE